MSTRSLNRIYTKPWMRRRYEAWFLKLMLADGSGAWWFRYLLMNLGRREGGGCSGGPRGMPAQVWATWFPRESAPEHFIQGFKQDGLSLGNEPFRVSIGDNRIDETACSGRIEDGGHAVSWDLAYRSTFSSTMSDVTWIGFSRTPHSDAVFKGRIDFDGRGFAGDVLGYGLQGHNCGYRHRNLWTWTHLLALGPAGPATAFEALEYDIGGGMMFRKALLWHEGTLHTFKGFTSILRDPEALQWKFKCGDERKRLRLKVEVDGSGRSLHRLPYMKTDCSGTFEVSNNSLATGVLLLERAGGAEEVIQASGGAVLEMAGRA